MGAVEKWWAFLKHLSRKAKIELASTLIDSLKLPDEPKKKNDDFEKLYGAWADEEGSAEELIEFLRNSRSPNSKIESFD